MRKFLMMLVGSAFFTGTPAVASDAQTVQLCLKKYSLYVYSEEVSAVDASCKKLLFPPSPDFKLGSWRMGGNEVHAYAVLCQQRYGSEAADLASISDTSCKLFYHPASGNTMQLRIKLPELQSGSLVGY